ncbi:MAG: ABC transporter ATP-binding protein/permease [Clostridia bacterium]|nr:ABC transporter ATP-binding protein/permease [Clostridia bacterium]
MRRETFKRILKELRPDMPLVILSLFLAAVCVAGTLTLPILIGDIIEVLVEGMDVYSITVDLLLIASVVLLYIVAQYFMSVINNRIVYSVSKRVRDRAFSKIQTLPLSFLDSTSYGEIVSRCIADVDTYVQGLLLAFTQFFSGVLTIVATLALMLYFNWIIALVVFVLTPLSLFVARYISNHSYKYFKKTAEVRGEETAYIEEMVGGMKEVEAFNMEEETAEKFDDINERLTGVSLKSLFYSSLTNPCTRFVNSVIYALVALTGAMTIIFGGMAALLPAAFNVGRLTTLLSYANQYTKPFTDISDVITELQNAMACAARVYELIDETPEPREKKDLLTDIKGHVETRGVAFSYDPERKFIENLCIEAPAGKMVALVGPTGCGKTTIINLLMRFYDVDEGKVTVDGRDVKDVRRSSLRKNYGMVLQDTWLKAGTVRDNIVMGKADATNEEVVAAAKAAHAHSFIMQLPEGYDTYLEEDGGSLSQGQKQLLCIARIMLDLPPMLILDEATSSIDTRTEQLIQKSFSEIMKGRTSFMVAHRLSTVKNADLILVMRDGKIVERGTHEELIKMRGYYFELYRSQFAV